MTPGKPHHIDAVTETIWAFARGDMPPRVFEQWVYAETTLEDRLGKALYMDVISANYADRVAVDTVKRQLADYARSTVPPRCECITLPATAVLDMGDDQANALFGSLGSLEEKKRRGDPYWWLSLYQCSRCQQSWLVGQEERQNDVFCLRRLESPVAQAILDQNRWPDIFDRYETLIRLGHDAGHRVRFVDPLNSSLVWTVRDLALQRPGIGIAEIAELLNLDMPLAVEVARKVIDEHEVVIDFGA